MSTPKTDTLKTNNLADALKELDSAIDDWEKITSKPLKEQDFSKERLEKTRELLLKLREQLNELSKD